MGPGLLLPLLAAGPLKINIILGSGYLMACKHSGEATRKES